MIVVPMRMVVEDRGERTFAIERLDEKGQRYDIGPGDKLILPAGTRRAEGETTEEVTYIVTVSDTRPLKESLALLGLD